MKYTDDKEKYLSQFSKFSLKIHGLLMTALQLIFVEFEHNC